MRTIEGRILSFLANYRGDNRVLIRLLIDAEMELRRRQLEREHWIKTVENHLAECDMLELDRQEVLKALRENDNGVAV